MKTAFGFLVLSFTLLHAEPGLVLLSTHHTKVFDEGAAEIASYDPVTKRVFFMNGHERTIEVLDVSEPAVPKALNSFDFGDYGHEANSLACHSGLLAVAVEMEDATLPGAVLLFTTDGTFLHDFRVGALPDAVAFSPDGKTILAANEGEPSDDYKTDPEGTVTIISLTGHAEDYSRAPVTEVGFANLTKEDLDKSVRIFGPGASVAQDLEPEFIAFSPEGSKAYITLQENNAIAVIDLASKQVVGVHGLGFKDHSKEGNGFDASNKSDEISIVPRPTKGMFQPDAVACAEIGGKRYLFTANEGDARDYEGYSEEARVEDLKLDPKVFPNAAELQDAKNLGRLKTTTANGDIDGDGDYDEIYSYGARSFSVWDAESLELVYDSGDLLERTLADQDSEHFNSDNNDNDSWKGRSDDKGPEPEGVAIGVIGVKTFLFVGLERMGGIAMFDVSTPASPNMISYVNPRDFAVTADSKDAGDIGPEGLEFVSAAASPNGQPLLIVANEVSGTVSIYQVSGE